MSPGILLCVSVLLTAVAAISERFLRRRHQARLKKIAASWQMNYSPLDQLRLTPHVARNFPIAGAANIRVVDLIYGIDCDVYRYVFTTEYTAGVVTGKRRIIRAGTFSEPRDRTGDMVIAPIVLAPANLPLLTQYLKLTPTCASSIHERAQEIPCLTSAAK